ncbi:DNA damage-regulated autophagy modulator protein 1-like [Mixophyes fleayi]|uniref:DNA damage-regulated autophagy modulator protein 1-like n=1 Tax=Mixophyes fleayi TaxID=3061075 RepID=UPI003F4E395F
MQQLAVDLNLGVMELEGLAILPIFWVFWTLGGLFLAYFLTINQGHASTLLVYISEMGNFYPEAIVFAAVLTVSAILGAVTTYILYRFMTIQAANKEIHHPLLQKILLAIGWISSIGTLVVAAFPWEPHPYIHRSGAAVAFGFGVLYNIFQSIYLYKISFSSRYTCHIRMVLSALMAMTLLIFLVCKIPLLMDLCQGSKFAEICDVSAVVAEWITMVGFMMHYLTCYTDFQHLCIQECRKGHMISMREKISEEQTYM